MGSKLVHGIASLSAACLMLFASACGLNTVVKKNTVYADTFKNVEDIQKKAEILRVGETSCPEGIHAAGFNLYGANVKKLPGAMGSRYFLTENFYFSSTDPAQLQQLAKELSQYTTWLFPFTEVESKEKLLYAYEQNTRTTGKDVQYVIVCRNNVLFFHGLTGEKTIQRNEKKISLMGNLGILVGAIAGIFALKGF